MKKISEEYRITFWLIEGYETMYPDFELSCFGNSKLTQKRFKDLIDISKMDDIKYQKNMNH